jgi:2-hydroxychromene-2-carboxylate isomerase
MSSSIEFYLDFTSPYAYLGQHRIRKLAQVRGLEIQWKPILLGAIFRDLGQFPAPPGSPRRAYAWHDIERCAEFLGLAYLRPDPFPFNSLPASRMFYALQAAGEDKQSVEWAQAVFHASFAQGRDCSDAGELVRLANGMGLDGEGLLESAGKESIKKKFRDMTAEAAARGIFGVPTFFLDDEMFWGSDRIQQIEWRLNRSN